MTALKKRDGSAASRDSFRRLVAKTLARQFNGEVEHACSPFQSALSTRVRVDCVGHAVWAGTDADHSATVLSVDGIGSYDHVFQVSMLTKLLEVPRLRKLLPFVRNTYVAPSCYTWEDAEGRSTHATLVTLFPAERKREQSTTLSKNGCARWQGSNCMRAKPESGTELVCVHPRVS